MAVLIVWWFTGRIDQPTQVNLSTAIELSQDGNVEKVTIEPEESIMRLVVKGVPSNVRDIENNPVAANDGTELISDIGWHTVPDLVELGLVLPADYTVETNTGIRIGEVLLTMLPILFFAGLLIFFFRSARGANSQAMSFGRSKAKLFPADTPTITFDDVAGVDEAKQELEEVVDFLKSRERFQKLGARIPRGVLLIGPPGTGKTLIAKAVAGEAGVPFFSISGSEFVEMFVGVGASRVRDLFEQAKRSRPCIIFMDEIDAVGRHRGAGLGGSHDEREQTLNQILTEMDGFDTAGGVIVLAATNRPDILDPALLRPGRFDRRVMLDRPDVVGREAILRVHAKGKPMVKNVELAAVAKQTVGFSGAELANLLNEAAILAARRNKTKISMDELNESVDRVLAGPERKSRKVSEHEKELTAYHESGHALVSHVLKDADPVLKVTIVPRGMAGGYTRMAPLEDRSFYAPTQLMAQLAVSLGGGMAEEMIFGEASTGPRSDLQQATQMARRMVTDFGMSAKLGPRTFGSKEEMVFLGREISEQRDYSDKIAELIDDEVRRLIDEALSIAKKVLTQHRDRLEYIAKQLLVRETLDGEILLAVLDGKPVPKPRQKAKTKPVKRATRTRAAVSRPKTTPPIEPESSPGTAPA
jgi:cell division protease FtsH